MPKMETLKSLLPFLYLLDSTPRARDCYRLDTWPYICSFWKTIRQHISSHKNVYIFRSCHPVVIIYFQKRPPSLPSLLTDKTVKLITTCIFPLVVSSGWNLVPLELLMVECPLSSDVTPSRGCPWPRGREHQHLLPPHKPAGTQWERTS